MLQTTYPIWMLVKYELTDLNCRSNTLTNLDISRNEGLVYLNCYDNNLKKLDLSKNTSLVHLTCGKNYLSNLDVKNNSALSIINCAYNELSGASLNSIFENLPFAVDKKFIDFSGNQGIEACDVNILKRKGWSWVSDGSVTYVDDVGRY